jgi:hypothetical protein
VGGRRRGLDHHQGARGHHGEGEAAEGTAELFLPHGRRRKLPVRGGRDEIAERRLGQTELAKIPRQGGLGHHDAPLLQELLELRLGAHGAGPHEIHDGLLPLPGAFLWMFIHGE